MAPVGTAFCRTTDKGGNNKEYIEEEIVVRQDAMPAIGVYNHTFYPLGIN